MKYREEFEAYQRSLPFSKQARFSQTSRIEGRYDNPIMDTLYRTFAAGYEAALKKGQNDE